MFTKSSDGMMARLFSRFVFVWILLLACSLALSQQVLADPKLQIKVTYTTLGTPIKEVLSELQQQSGVGLIADVVLQKEILAVRVEGVTLADLMKRIETAATAKWVKSGDRFQLTVDKAAEKEIEARLNEQRTKGLATSIAKFLKTQKLDQQVDYEKLAQKARDLLNQINLALTNGGKYEPLMAEMSKIGSSSPAQRALARIIASFPTASLLDLAPGEKIVYSTSPTRMQQRFPTSCSGAIQQFFKEHNQWAKGLSAADSTVGTEKTSGSVWSSDWPNLNVKPMAMGDAYFLLSLSRNSYENGIQVELQIAGSDGRLIDSAVAGLAESTDSKEITGEGDTQEIVVDSDSLAFAKLLQGDFGELAPGAQPRWQGQLVENGVRTMTMNPDSPEDVFEGSPRIPFVPVPKMSTKVADWVFNPDRYDPLAVLVTPILFKAAGAQKTSVVALMSDRILANIGDFLKAKPTAAKLWALAERTGHTVNRSDKWLVVGPEDPGRTRSTRIDRGALARLIRTCSSGLYRMRDVATYAATRPLIVDSYPQLDVSLIRCTYGRAANALTMLEEWARYLPALRIVGSLTESQWSTLKSGTGIRLTPINMPLGQLSAATLYGSIGYFEIEPAQPSHPDPQLDRIGGFDLGSIKTEATIAFPDGVGPNLMLGLKGRDMQCCVAFRSDNGAPTILTADDIGYMEARPSPDSPKFEKFRVLQGSRLQLLIVGPDGSKAVFTFEDIDFAPGSGATVGFMELPEAFRDRVTKAQKAFGG